MRDVLAFWGRQSFFVAVMSVLVFVPQLVLRDAQAVFPLESRMCVVQTKSWTEVPEAYRVTSPQRNTCVGVQHNPARRSQELLYLHRIGNMGWKYVVRDDKGRTCTIYAGMDWKWNIGDRVVISGTVDEASVFIPQGERCYG